ncbi:MAG: NAD(P)H-dependent FMN reductase [Flavobacteriales bacterium]|jgi:chromate reductase
MKDQKLTVIIGTHRPNSNSEMVAQHYLNELKKLEVDFSVLFLKDLPADFLFTEMFGSRTATFETIIETYIVPATKFVFIIPEYNGGFPGILKSFIDCVPPVHFQGKKAGLIGLSSGAAGALRPMDQFTNVLNYLKVTVLYLKPKLSGIDRILVNGVLKDEFAKNALAEHATLMSDF